VNAREIDQWAQSREAQARLPLLVRKLIHATAERLVRVDFPAGDSITQPGWDGQVESEEQTSWIPQGVSFWELSCEAQPTGKANSDYDTRTMQTPEPERAKATFIFATSRRWSSKANWLREKRQAGEWKDVRAYDANDLEQWLEQTPAVGLWFAETLGRTGQGVESPEHYWRAWSEQSDPLISPAALFADREHVRKQLLDNLRERLADGKGAMLTIRADSAEEATAFVCAAILREEDLTTVAVVVTDPAGWRFVGTNLSVKVAIASRSEITKRVTPQDNLVVVIPHTLGDMVKQQSESLLALPRPRPQEFRQALNSLGLDEAEAERLTVNTGRSWSVFRRHCSRNPAIRSPEWLELPQAVALSTICLLGAWKGDRPEDREIVSQLAGRPYEEVERDLRQLAHVDDAPIIQIGTVWKAKSPLELLDLIGGRLTSGELDRFFDISQKILSEADPMLELPEEERYAAQIHGKVRPQSKILIDALCDTLVKLAASGPFRGSLQALNIEERVTALVRVLLGDADGVRWFSLASCLPMLAEAAPDAFLEAVEHSLARPDQPVISLLKETSGNILFGRCWQSGLLRALEILAWSAEYMPRVALILARLADVEVKGNWANTPLNSLVGIFRPWIPQTTASIDQRIQALDTIIQREPKAAIELLDRLTPTGSDTAIPAARPKWRGYDTGAGYGATRQEIAQMWSAAADRLFSLARGYPERVAHLIEKISGFDKERFSAVLELAAEFGSPEIMDEAKETVRAALRDRLYWHLNYDKTSGAELREKLAPVQELYAKLAPQDPVARHRWLFAEGWPRLPTYLGTDHAARAQRLEAERLQALREIHEAMGMDGIEKLATVPRKTLDRNDLG